jgi:replicative DNA helicase
MVNERQPVDLITIGNRLKDGQILDGIGGHSYLSYLMDCVPSAGNFSYYLGILREKTAQRRIAATCAATVSNLREGIPPNLDHIEAALTDARSVGVQANGSHASIKTVAKELCNWIEDRKKNRGKLSGVPTGITRLDRIIDGLQLAELTLIAARPSVGKTALGCCIALHAASENFPTLFITAEMSRKMILRRMVCNEASISMTVVKEGTIDDDAHMKLGKAIQRILEMPLTFDEQMGGCTIGKLGASIRKGVRSNGVKLVVIDYIQKFKSDREREKKTEEIADVCSELQKISRETGVAIVALAQLNRENEKEKKTRTPKLTDLGDSKQLEQDADTVIMIHRDRAETKGEAELHIVKQRDGECGMVKTHYEGRFCRFANLHTSIDPDAQ